ncbi:MLO-like protein 1 [Tasmannia lanceolata]|uniref:MLO-like protein 1 n=1 Tax=Tasmannia lanceolata TaxID=3420 RepID=UPI00406335BC
MTEGDGGSSMPLEYTPTWVVAAVCFVIVAISLVLERILHFLGKYLKKKNQKPLFEALLKVKEELMLLGFISLLLTVFQGAISRMCIPESWTLHMLPCKKENQNVETTQHLKSFFFSGILGSGRRLLSEGSSVVRCSKGNAPFLSLEALHQLHIFIFVLAIVHVIFCVLTMFLGGAKIRQWKHWEDSIAKEKYDTDKVLKKFTDVHQHDFIRDNFKGFGKDSAMLGWLSAFTKQFYPAVTKSDYITLRLGFIMTHCRGNPKFDFHKYLMRTLEADFKKVVGISWYLWVFVVLFLLLNVAGWHTYFWIAFIPLILLLAVGTKLEHVITQLAHDVAEKHTAIEGDLVVQPSDDHFWFGRPKIVLYLTQFILFQNAFEIAFFFWILFTYGFDSCIMGQVRYIVPRLIIGAIIQILCSYSTLPLYAIVTQMGSSFKKAIFEEHVQVGLVGWAQKVKNRRGSKANSNGRDGSSEVGSVTGIQLQKVGQRESSMEEGIATDDQSTNSSKRAVP